MIGLDLVTPWQQPRWSGGSGVNDASALAQGLHDGIVIDEALNWSTAGNPLTFSAAKETYFLRRPGPGGTLLTSGNTSVNVYGRTLDAPSTLSWTISVLVRPQQGLTAMTKIAGATWWGLYAGTGTQQRLCWANRYAGDVLTVYATDTADYVVGAAYALTAVVRYGVGGELWVNGQLVASYSNTAAHVVNVAHPSWYAWAGIEGGWLHTRALFADEVQALHADPYQLVAPQRIWVPVGLAAGGGAALGSDAGVADASGTGVLSTASVLASSNAQATAQSSGTLTAQAALASAGGTASAAGTATLTTGSSGAALGSTGGTVAASGSGTLTVRAALASSAAAAEFAGSGALNGDTNETSAPGGYEDGPIARTKRPKQSVIHKDDSEQRRLEFEALLARVKGQAVEKAASAADRHPPDSSAPTQDFKPPRMPEVRGVAPELLRQWMPDLLATFRTEYRNAYLDQVAQAAKRRAEFAAIAEEEAILIVATL